MWQKRGFKTGQYRLYEPENIGKQVIIARDNKPVFSSPGSHRPHADCSGSGLENAPYDS